MPSPSASAVPSPFITPKELAARWRVTRTTADRLARRQGFARVHLGYGRAGTVRYRLDEVVAFEQSRTLRPHP